MNDLYQNFDEDIPSTQADFQVAESYRWVRTGLHFLLAAYLIFVPGIVFLILCRTAFANADGVLIMLLASTMALLVGMALLIIGGVLLRFAPRQNERNEINKFLISYAISFGCLFVSWFVKFQGLDIAKNIAQAYGTFYLIQFFTVLAINRHNAALERLSLLIHKWYVIGILALLAFSFVGKALGIFAVVALLGLAIFAVVFYVMWLRTLWLAIKSTHFISSDVVRDYLD